jgi:hypothetical protein
LETVAALNRNAHVDTPVIEAATTGSKIEIVSPSGYRISISGAYDPEALCRLVRGLSS